MTKYSTLKIVNSHLDYDHVSLMEPSKSTYLHIALEVDKTFIPFYLFDKKKQNLEVWNYTAGWFQKETNLDNSTLLLPTKTEASAYTVINHCRWDNLKAIIPSLLFKKTFKKYVLDNFYANRVGAMPILYKLIQ
jgi:hypothetical protein